MSKVFRSCDDDLNWKLSVGGSVGFSGIFSKKTDFDTSIRLPTIHLDVKM